VRQKDSEIKALKARLSELEELKAVVAELQRSSGRRSAGSE